MPARNERDLDDIPKDIRGDLKVHLIKRVDEVLSLVLEPPVAVPTPPRRSRTASRAPRSERRRAPAERELRRQGLRRRGVLAVALRPRRGRGARRLRRCSAAVGFLPLFGGPGYEQSLASGLVVPVAAAIASALELVGRATSRRARWPASGAGIATGAILAGVAFATALLHGLRVGICDFWGGARLLRADRGVRRRWSAARGARSSPRSCRGRRRRRLRVRAAGARRAARRDRR